MQTANATAAAILAGIRAGETPEILRTCAGGSPIISLYGDVLTFDEWNAWIEETHPKLTHLLIDEATVPLYDKPLTKLDVVNILRKSCWKEDGSGLVSVNEAVAIYDEAKAKGEEGFETFLEFIKIVGCSHKMIA